MSLLLRQKTEEILEDAGLSEFHTSIVNKYMTISGQCGQTIVTIRGIQFSRANPSIKEISYSLKLFQKYIENNVKILTKYKKARQAEKKAKETYDQEVAKVPELVGDTWSLRYILNDKSYMKFLTNTENEVQVSFYGSTPFDTLVSEIGKVKRLSTSINKILELRQAMIKANSNIDEIRKELQMCDV